MHKDQFGGQRWLEFEELILNYRNTKSFEMGRVGDYTFPTLLAARYALQIDQEWPEFMTLAGHMIRFLYDREHTGSGGPGRRGGGYGPPLRSHRIRQLPIMLAQYLIKHKLKPSWAGALYETLKSQWEAGLRPWRTNAETGEVGPNTEGELYRDQYNDDRVMFGWGMTRENLGFTDDEEVELSRVVPQLGKLLGH